MATDAPSKGACSPHSSGPSAFPSSTDNSTILGAETWTPAAVLILAGGLATRLRPITEKVPKCLVEVQGRPFIDFQLKNLRSEGIESVILSVGYRGEMVEEYVGNGSRYGLSVKYAYDGPQLLGTGGAIRQALDLLPNRFFVLYGDSYLRCSYRSVEEAFIASGKRGLMTVFRNEGSWDTSNVVFEEGRLITYSKRTRSPEMHFIDYGLSMFDKSVFLRIPESTPYDLATLMEELIHEGQLAGSEAHNRFFEIGSHEGLHDFERFALDTGLI